MKKICFLISFLYILGNVLGQNKGVTEHGDPVILYDDGTWIYEKYGQYTIRRNPRKR
ncbi:MAG: hypothetical protein IPL08_11475 [Saprospiraceae bacterium]|nr:hypothetical protein [Saprospiraceae bacterium]